VVSPALQRSSAATAARSTRMVHCSLFAHQRDTSRSTCQRRATTGSGHPTPRRFARLRLAVLTCGCAFSRVPCANDQCYRTPYSYSGMSLGCRIILHGVVLIHGIFNCEIIDDHRTAGTRRVPCRNTHSVTHAAATRLDHTRLKGSLACGERPHTPGQASLGAHTVRVPGPLLSVRDDMHWPLLWSSGTLWSSFRSGRRGRGWI
jgi:hypothetical protein